MLQFIELVVCSPGMGRGNDEGIVVMPQQGIPEH